MNNALQETAPSVIKFSDLNLVKQCDQAFPLAIVDQATGKKTAFVIDVLGDHSDTVKGFVRRELNARRTRAALQVKKGKDIEVTTVEDDESFVIESAVARVVGWQGIDREFSADNARELFAINPDIRTQVMAASSELANFTKR